MSSKVKGWSFIDLVVEILFVNKPEAENILFLFNTCLVSIFKDVLILLLLSFLILSINIRVFPPELLFWINVLSSYFSRNWKLSLRYNFGVINISELWLRGI